MIYEIFRQLGTKEYYSNLAAEFTGLLIEILVLTVSIPLFIYIINQFKFRRIRLILRIEILKLYSTLTSAIVDFVLGPSKFKELTSITCNDDFKYVSNHEYYDQLDNNLLLITKKITPSDITLCIRNADSIKLNEFVNKFKECTLNFDRLISLLSFLPKKQAELYSLRQIFIVVEEIFTTYLKKKEEVADPNPFISLEKSGHVIHSLGIDIDRISKKDRRIVNRRLLTGGLLALPILLITFITKKFNRKK